MNVIDASLLVLSFVEMNSNHLLDNFEGRLLQHVASFDVVREPMDHSLWYMLTAFERWNYWYECRTSDIHALQFRRDDLKYGVMYACNWIESRAESKGKFRPPNAYNLRRIRQAQDIVELGCAYKPIKTFLWLARKGKVEASLISDREIAFKGYSRELQYDALDWLVHSRDLNRRFEDWSDKESDVSVFYPIVERNVRRARVYGDWSIKLQFLPSDVAALGSILEKDRRQSRGTPESWSFLEIPISTYRRIWSALDGVAFLYDSVVRWLFQNEGRNWDTFVGWNYLTSRVELTTLLCGVLPEVSPEQIGAVVDLLIFDVQSKTGDPALQYLVPLGSDSLSIAPKLILTGNLERNFMSLLCRKHNDQYNASTSVLEDALASELSHCVESRGFIAAKKVKLPRNRRLPDVDLVVYDRASRFVMVIELKWVIGVSEYYEIASRMETEVKGRRQVQDILSYARSEPSDFWTRAFPGLEKPADFEVGGCLCMRGFCGGADSQLSRVPTVEYTILRDWFERSTSLRQQWQWLENQEFLPKEGLDYSVLSNKRVFGPFTAHIPSYQLLKI
ncbi:MAG: hypothetical protein WAU88_00920 [Candidatus Zixiibacteriota bacterium]